MSRTVTLLQLRTDIAFQADVVMGTTGRYQTAMVNRFINQSIQRFRERISQEGIQHYLVASSGTIQAGNTAPYPFAVLDCTGFTPSVVRTYGVDITLNSVTKSLIHRPFTERAMFGGPDVLGEPERWANFQTAKLAIMPGPMFDYTYLVWYLPLLADLSADGDTFDGVAGWEEYIVWDVVCRLINRDQYAQAFVTASKQRDENWADILRGATRVSAAGGAVVGRDSFARQVHRKFDFGAASSISTHSIVNSMLATMAAGYIKGRAIDAGGFGDVQDLSGAQVAQIIPAFAGAAAGLVPTGPGSSAYFLNGAGAWAVPAGGGGGGGAPGGPTLALQFNAGSGVFGGMTGVKMQGSGLGLNAVGITTASLSAPVFNAARAGLVPTATSANLFLRDDGSWQGVPSFVVASGGGVPTMLAAGAQNQLQYNAGSGFGGATGLSILGGGVGLNAGAVVAASLSAPLFSPLRAGLVPTATSAQLFLRDDGVWAGVPSFTIPAGGGPTMLAAAPAGSIQYNYGSGLGGATGLSVVGSGVGLNARAITVASLSAPLFGTNAGIVPTAAGAGLFLRDDATWQSVGTGVSNAQLAPMAQPRVKGRFTLGTGTPEDLTGAQVASLLPWFVSSTAGLVPVPSNVAGNFLKDDGTWAQVSGGGGGGGGGSPGLPTGSVQYNAGSGIFAGASGFLWDGTTLQRFGDVNFPTGGLYFRPSGAFPQINVLMKVGGGGATRIITALGVNGLPADLVSRNVDGQDSTTWGANSTAYSDNHFRGSGAHYWYVGPTRKMELDAYHYGLATGVVLTYQNAIGGSGLEDRLATWNGSGIANMATGIFSVASGSALQFGNVGGPLVGYSGISFSGVYGVGNAQQAAVQQGIFKGRFSPGSGSPEDLSPLQAASLLPRMLGSGFGLIASATGGVAGNYLRDDGSWQPVSAGGGPTMLAGGAAGSVQYNGGSGFFGAIGITINPGVVAGVRSLNLGQSQQLGLQLLSFSGVNDKLTTFTPSGFLNSATGITVLASGVGLLVGASGGPGPFLHASGLSFNNVFGVPNSQLTPLPPFSFKGRSSAGTGSPEDLTIGQAASMLPVFLGSGFGFVPNPTGGALGKYLRDDGSWQGVPSFTTSAGGGPTMLAAAPAGSVQYNYGSGLGGATGLSVVGSGVGLNMVGLTTASLSAPLFGSTRAGLVPTSTAAGNFLRDDGTWQTPSSGNATGVGNAQILPMPPLTFKANFSGVSGIPQDITNRQAASLLPVFYGSGGSPGLVTTPTFGPSGYYLRDDGTWQELLRNEVANGNTGSGATVGSFTVDFNKGPFHKLTLFGNQQISLAPPSGIHRHTQLRISIGASGLMPTFYGTMVKPQGGSGNWPSWNSASGAVNIVNFFHDGSLMYLNGGGYGTTA